MKKILYFLSFIGLLWACNPMEDTYKKLDDNKDPYSSNISYTLVSSDYTKAVGFAKADALTHDDSTWAGYIASFTAFNDKFTAEDYIPKILPSLFPAYNFGSTAKITYNQFEDMPQDFSAYTNADEYSFSAGDYAKVDSLTGITGYLYPDFNPDLYIPEILAVSIANPQKDDMIKVNYKYSDVNPLINVVNNTTLFEEKFDAGLGLFDTINVAGSKVWAQSSYGSDTYAKISGYQQDNEDWLISNSISLGNDDVILNFTQAIKFLNHQWNQIAVLISDNYDGNNLGTATWTQIDWGLVADTANLGSDYTFYPSGDIDISAYKNKTIHIAFKYTSTVANAATWEIADVKVTALTQGYTVTGKTPYTKTDYYKYNGTNWAKMDNVYYLNSEDYNAMGDPGSHDNFSSTILPNDYIPKYLDNLYPTAGNGVSAIVVYKYYTGTTMGTLTIADEYTYKSGTWNSSYSFISTVTNQFVYSAIGWIFDPTVRFTISASDYQLIVNYVKENIGTSYIDSYGTAESYYGTSAYYSEFQIASGKWDSDVFATWQDAAKEAIGKVLLPMLYPNATIQSNGVDVNYVVTFTTYNAGSTVNYNITFKVSKEGPDPEFELVDGPTVN